MRNGLQCNARAEIVCNETSQPLFGHKGAVGVGWGWRGEGGGGVTANFIIDDIIAFTRLAQKIN